MEAGAVSLSNVAPELRQGDGRKRNLKKIVNDELETDDNDDGISDSFVSIRTREDDEGVYGG